MLIISEADKAFLAEIEEVCRKHNRYLDSSDRLFIAHVRKDYQLQGGFEQDDDFEDDSRALHWREPDENIYYRAWVEE